VSVAPIVNAYDVEVAPAQHTVEMTQRVNSVEAVQKNYDVYIKDGI